MIMQSKSKQKKPTKSAFEDDVVYARRIYKYTQRAGVCKKAKRQINRRSRYAYKGEIE